MATAIEGVLPEWVGVVTEPAQTVAGITDTADSEVTIPANADVLAIRPTSGDRHVAFGGSAGAAPRVTVADGEIGLFGFGRTRGPPYSASLRAAAGTVSADVAMARLRRRARTPRGGGEGRGGAGARLGAS